MCLNSSTLSKKNLQRRKTRIIVTLKPGKKLEDDMLSPDVMISDSLGQRKTA